MMLDRAALGKPFLVLLAMALAACSSDDGSDPEGAGGNSGTSARSFSFEQPDFTVESGEEFTWCYRYPIPEEHRVSGPMYVTGFQSELATGTHHYFAYYNGDPRPETKVVDPTPCYDDGPRGAVTDARADVLKDGPGPTFGAPEGTGEYFLPTGHAYILPSTDGYFVTDHHVFNTTDTRQTISGRLTYHYSPPETITHVLNMMTCAQWGIYIGPNSEAKVSATCIATEPIELVVLASHAHQHLTSFKQFFFDGTALSSEPIYESLDWDSPKIDVLDEPLHLEPGQGIKVECSFTNTLSTAILPGVGEAGEMCVGMNLFYRTNNPRDTPTLGAAVFTPDGTGDIQPGGVCGPFGANKCRTP